MPVFNPNIPVAHTQNDAAEIQANFLALHEEATAPETDPVFTAAEAANLVPGDKAKIDGALQPGDNVSALTNDAGYLTNPLATNPLNCNGAAITGVDSVSVASKLIDGNTNTPTVDVAQHTLKNGTGQTIVDFKGRIPGVDDPGMQLNDGAGNGFLDTTERTLIGSDGVTVAAQWASGQLKDGAGNAFSIRAFAPANPGHWAGSPPASVAAAIDIIAAILSNNGANPIG